MAILLYVIEHLKEKRLVHRRRFTKHKENTYMGASRDYARFPN